MRLYPFAAALLLGGTCALAFAPTYRPVGEEIADAAARLHASMADQNAGNPDPDLDLAVDPNAVETAATDAADARADGVGGPYEPVEEAAPAAATLAAALDTTPQPAAQNYPPCDPGPGDDSCIQLYEPGVRVALASWTQPTGGLADPNAPATAMGGPYEPVDEAAHVHESAYVGDGTVEFARGETAADEIAEALASANEAEYTGMGGPIAETGYPPCSATVTDRCIQLYEPGVTGEGN